MTALTAVRLVIDASKCDGHAICVLRDPERISLDEWGYAQVDATPIESVAGIARAGRAVRACPAGALSITETTTR